ncbi:MAG: trypsin, partial [Allomuricauda sp.]
MTTICWDVSHSMQDRDLKKEFYFLDAYFKDLGEAKVILLTFSNQLITQEEFSVKEGQWNLIREKLENQKYDGGTSFEGLEDYAQDGDVLLFTDGKQTAGSSTP